MACIRGSGGMRGLQGSCCWHEGRWQQLHGSSAPLVRAMPGAACVCVCERYVPCVRPRASPCVPCARPRAFLQVLNLLLESREIGADKASAAKLRFSRLHDAVVQAMSRETRLLDEAKGLKRRLDVSLLTCLGGRGVGDGKARLGTGSDSGHT